MKRIPDLLLCELEKLLSSKKRRVDRPEFDSRKTFEGILYILRMGAQWDALPEKYGNYKTVHGKFMKWAKKGIFHKVMVKSREYYRKRNKKNFWYAIDTSLKKAPFASFGDKNPTDRAKK